MDSSRQPPLTPSGHAPKYPLTGWHSNSLSAATRNYPSSFKTLRETSGMKFRPLGDRVVVRRVAEDQKTPGGIIIPDTVQEKPQQGEIISVGPGALDDN